MDQNHEIARIAYELYLMRGGMPGDPVSDWVTAERIFAERQAQVQPLQLLEENVISNYETANVTVDETPAAVEAKPAKAKTRKPAAAKKEPRKAEMKAAPVKEEKKVVEEKKVEEPRAKKTTRKKTGSKE